MNILVTGANGQLGSSLRNAARNSNDNYLFTDVADLDITDPQAVEEMVAGNGIRVVINCAAYTNVDKAEDDRDFAEALNAGAVRNLARAVKANNGTLIHISTDYVFGGSLGNTPRTESEPANPAPRPMPRIWPPPSYASSPTASSRAARASTTTPTRGFAPGTTSPR